VTRFRSGLVAVRWVGIVPLALAVIGSIYRAPAERTGVARTFYVIVLAVGGLVRRRPRASTGKRRGPAPQGRLLVELASTADRGNSPESATVPTSTAEHTLELAYEAACRERDELRARVEDLEAELARYADDKPYAAERERLLAEIEHLTSLAAELRSGYRALVVAGLELLEDHGGDAPAAEEAIRDRPRLHGDAQ
jgi:hypothetical protein